MSSAEVLASVDIVALRLTPESQRLQVLLHQRQRTPYKGQWALPGVIVNGSTADNNLDAAACRALAEKAKVYPRHLEQVGTEGNASRDPRGWTLSTYYLALLDPAVVVEDQQIAFFDLQGVLDNEPPLPFDHRLLVERAYERLAAKAVYTNLPLYLAPERFTVLDALAAAQACLGQPVNNTSMRKRLERMKSEGWVQDTGEKNQPRLGRPQQLYRHTPQGSGAFMFDRSLLAGG
ncbi:MULTISPECIES: NUDIX hydrolase [unclassified Pseudomonas]|uniref:NUDIX hydrolase n=1 Tax=unclassified Pseudomonas TaxID=196821 RepID=UPI0019426DDD|nr:MULTISPECIES: NUDIX hydrolase [unclassified Pseudomonas]MCE0915724.1 NUDIX hydrolase [Pseudomonas sp. NMI760_13]MCP8633591.1 NUDIX hydrolase [Pseudomonas sp. DVZ6]MDD7787162.1 NUDIX hydrolase [Pseudomonas sp. DVZ24]BCJ06712.1 NUDIX hydrolase [Pseudomonas sp. RtIB026]